MSTHLEEDFQTSSGIPVKAVYTYDDVVDPESHVATEIGSPGENPFTRGMSEEGYRKEPWKLEMYAGFGTADDANERFRFLINNGSTGGVSIALDLPTQIGLDPDEPFARMESGQAGVAISSLADVERMFNGIPLHEVGHIFTTANCISPIAAAWFFALAARHGVPTTDFTVQIQNDPIKEYIARGTQFLPIEAALRLNADMFEYVCEHAPTWLPISVSGSHMKQAGGSCVQEAAFTICNGISYVESYLERGMNIDKFGPKIELHFCTEMDLFEEVAKYRAVRTVWTELVRTRFGGTKVEAQHFRLHAATSGRPLTAQQPLNNIARITLQVLAQVLGGVEQTRTASFDEALGIPTELAARTSLRVNQIVAHETGVPLTVDPLGGSYYIETLTQEFCRQIREEISRVDEMGGAVAATRAGYFQDRIAEGAYRDQVAVEHGDKVIVGVNQYQVDEEVAIPVFELDESVVDRQILRVEELRRTRDHLAVEAALGELASVCQSTANMMPAVIKCVEVYATTGEIGQVWRNVFGEYEREVVRF